jgi:hypothetical protein
MKIPQSVRDEIAKGPLAHLTTLNKDGSPQVTVVWVGIEGEEFVIGYPGASSEDQEHPARRTRSAVLHRPEHQQGRNARKTTYANFRKSRAHARISIDSPRRPKSTLARGRGPYMAGGGE